jgi:hypothetical protein
MCEVLELDGQPCEAAWPYLSAAPADPKSWAPPADVGLLFHATMARSKLDPPAIRNALANDDPIIIVSNVSNAFYRPDADGVVDSSEPVDHSRIHAVVAVGHAIEGNDCFTLVRNSWGPRWGISGCAWISDRYLAPRIIETATIKTVI